MSLVGAERWRRVLSTRGVGTLISSDGAPTPLPDCAIESLRAEAGSDGHFSLRPAVLSVGEEVRIAAGPFADLTAAFQMESDADRVVVLLELLGRQTAVRLPAAHIERV